MRGSLSIDGAHRRWSGDGGAPPLATVYELSQLLQSELREPTWTRRLQPTIPAMNALFATLYDVVHPLDDKRAVHINKAVIKKLNAAIRRVWEKVGPIFRTSGHYDADDDFQHLKIENTFQRYMQQLVSHLIIRTLGTPVDLDRHRDAPMIGRLLVSLSKVMVDHLGPSYSQSVDMQGIPVSVRDVLDAMVCGSILENDQPTVWPMQGGLQMEDADSSWYGRTFVLVLTMIITVVIVRLVGNYIGPLMPRLESFQRDMIRKEYEKEKKEKDMIRKRKEHQESMELHWRGLRRSRYSKEINEAAEKFRQFLKENPKENSDENFKPFWSEILSQIKDNDNTFRNIFKPTPDYVEWDDWKEERSNVLREVGRMREDKNALIADLKAYEDGCAEELKRLNQTFSDIGETFLKAQQRVNELFYDKTVAGMRKPIEDMKNHADVVLRLYKRLERWLENNAKKLDDNGIDYKKLELDGFYTKELEERCRKIIIEWKDIISPIEKRQKEAEKERQAEKNGQFAREQAARERDARAKFARDQDLLRLFAARKQAEQEQAARKQAEQEQAEREQAALEQAAREQKQAAREQAAREQPPAPGPGAQHADYPDGDYPDGPYTCTTYSCAPIRSLVDLFAKPELTVTKDSKTMKMCLQRDFFGEGGVRHAYMAKCFIEGQWRDYVFKTYQVDDGKKSYYDDLETQAVTVFLCQKWMKSTEQKKVQGRHIRCIELRVVTYTRNGRTITGHLEEWLCEPEDYTKWTLNIPQIITPPPPELLQFSLWTFEYTRNRLIVCDLQGHSSNTEITLTDPALQCIFRKFDKKRFGPTNQGQGQHLQRFYHEELMKMGKRPIYPRFEGICTLFGSLPDDDQYYGMQGGESNTSRPPPMCTRCHRAITLDHKRVVVENVGENYHDECFFLHLTGQ